MPNLDYKKESVYWNNLHLQFHNINSTEEKRKSIKLCARTFDIKFNQTKKLPRNL
jgi:hypothetical protein